jgi:Mrp family chromosome partitioning ATPase
MQALGRPHDAAHDEAEVREEILRDLRARAAAAAIPQPRLGTLAAAIARTGESIPPMGVAADSRRSSPPTKRRGGPPSERPLPPRPTTRPPPAPLSVPEAPTTEPQIRAARAMATPTDSIAPAPVIVLSDDRRAHGAFRAPMPTPVFGPMPTPLPPLNAQVVVDAVEEAAVDSEEEAETQVWHAGAVQAALNAPQTALAIRPRSLPPLDDIPFVEPKLLDPRLVLLAEPDSPRSASFRLLRDNLLAKSAPRIIAVSSGAVHEGKTTCAINLALALSEKPSMRVLLMEGNFFAPSLAGIFHIDAVTPPDPRMNPPLLSPYRIARMIRGLHVAALVQDVGEPPPAFNSRWFDMVIDHLAGADYDHVVIDAAALDGSPAVAQVLGVAQGTLLTARSHSTTARSLRRAAEQIPEGRALGITLMDSDA